MLRIEVLFNGKLKVEGTVIPPLPITIKVGVWGVGGEVGMVNDH